MIIQDKMFKFLENLNSLSVIYNFIGHLIFVDTKKIPIK